MAAQPQPLRNCWRRCILACGDFRGGEECLWTSSSGSAGEAGRTGVATYRTDLDGADVSILMARTSALACRIFSSTGVGRVPDFVYFQFRWEPGGIPQLPAGLSRHLLRAPGSLYRRPREEYPAAPPGKSHSCRFLATAVNPCTTMTSDSCSASNTRTSFSSGCGFLMCQSRLRLPP